MPVDTNLNSTFKKNLKVFFSGNLIALSVAILLQFLIPKIVSISDYGIYKSFTLYLSYTSLLHFGFKDGAYLKLCEFLKLYPKRTSHYFSFMVMQQLFVALCIVMMSFIFKMPVKFLVLCLGFSSFFMILNTFYDSVYQSRNRFELVTILRIIKETVFLGFIIAGKFFFNEWGYKYLLSGYIISILIVFIIYTVKTKRFLTFSLDFINKKNHLKEVYKRGRVILLGNFGNQYISNLDRFFISIFFTVKEFAYYSFGGMFFVLTNTFVSSVSTVFLPYLIKDNSNSVKQYKKANKYNVLIILPLFIYMIAVFFVIQKIYPEYLISINYISLFFGGMVYSIYTNIIQNNYLKTLKLDSLYVRVNLLMVGLFISGMMLLYILDVELIYYSLLTSLILFIRYQINKYYIDQKLNISKKYWLYDLIIFTVGFITFKIGQNFIL